MATWNNRIAYSINNKLSLFGRSTFSIRIQSTSKIDLSVNLRKICIHTHSIHFLFYLYASIQVNSNEALTSIFHSQRVWYFSVQLETVVSIAKLRTEKTHTKISRFREISRRLVKIHDRSAIMIPSLRMERAASTGNGTYSSGRRLNVASVRVKLANEDASAFTLFATPNCCVTRN